MNFSELQEEWKKDCKIDNSDLAAESANCPQLHSKYYKIYSTEKLLLKKLESDMKVLELDKYEFYTQGPTEEQHKKGWKLPPKGVIIKSEVDN